MVLNQLSKLVFITFKLQTEYVVHFAKMKSMLDHRRWSLFCSFIRHQSGNIPLSGDTTRQSLSRVCEQYGVGLRPSGGSANGMFEDLGI